MKKLTIVTDDATAATIVQLVLGEKIDLQVEHITDDAPARRVVQTARHNHRRSDGKTSARVLAEALNPHGVAFGFTTDTARRILRDSGFAESTSGPLLSALIRAGYLKAHGEKANRTYEVVRLLDLDFKVR